MGMGCCCCQRNPPCTACEDGGPCSWIVDLNGIANGSCGDCATFFNDQFIATGYLFGSGCQWSYAFDPGDACGATLLTVEMFSSTFGGLPTWAIQVALRYDGGFNPSLWWNIYWRVGGYKPVKCKSFSALNLPYLSSDGPVPCDASASTCAVTARNKP